VHSIIIVTHGEMAAGLIQAAEMIVGQQEDLIPLHLKEMDSVEGLKDRIEEILPAPNTKQSVLLMVDLPGASPFNACARLAMERENLAVVSGANLPMLAEVLIQRKNSTLKELVETAKKSGKDGIKDLDEILNPES
jgi:mannose/fructose/sorbose-specific phosphotransferase system IIA component